MNQTGRIPCRPGDRTGQIRGKFIINRPLEILTLLKYAAIRFSTFWNIWQFFHSQLPKSRLLFAPAR